MEKSKARTAAEDDYRGPLGSDYINNYSEVSVIDFGDTDLLKISPERSKTSIFRTKTSRLSPKTQDTSDFTLGGVSDEHWEQFVQIGIHGLLDVLNCNILLREDLNSTPTRCRTRTFFFSPS